MDIVFKDKRFENQCNNQRLLERNHGQKRAKYILRRLNALRAAKVLEDMRGVSGRCHELRYDRRGQFSLDLDQPYRLIFEPVYQPIPTRPDGGTDWSNITAVRIIDVENTHE